MALREPQAANAQVMQTKDAALEVGSRVRVRSVHDITRTLDSARRLDGCAFVSQMEQFCGQEYTIIKTVKGVFDERLCKVYETKALLYILDGLICEGDVECFSRRCDRSCYFFWHQQWLEALGDTR